MIQKLEHIGVMVANMERSIQFYTEVLQLQLVNRVRLNEQTELAFLAFPGSDNIEIELVANGKTDLPNEGKVNHICFTVTDIEAEVERLKKLDVRLIDEKPREILDGMKNAFFYGPDDEKLEFLQKKS